MIKPVLPPACYTEQDWYEREQHEIFGRLWLLAGLTQQLAAEDSFITRDFSGTPVLVQNVKGQLRAFRNACAHRGMPIQTADHGVRKMICPYHGWGYREDGALQESRVQGSTTYARRRGTTPDCSVMRWRWLEASFSSVFPSSHYLSPSNSPARYSSS